jgi:hypothetical protein
LTRALLFCLVTLSLLGCEQILGLDELHDPGAGGDPDGVGDPCSVSVLSMISMEGTCQVIDEYCEGGTYPMDEAGGCAEGQQCCLGTGECEKFSAGGLYCAEGGSNPCAPNDGWTMGCPDGQWCCAPY